MNGCFNCRFKHKDLASKTCASYMFHCRTQATKQCCLNWKKEQWWQKLMREIKKVVKG